MSLHPPLSHFLSVFLSVLVCLFLLSLFLFSFFLARLRLGQGHTADDSEVESRQVCVTNNYFPRQASEHRASPSLEQTGKQVL